ncbi:MAG: HDIG domain-containing protein [Deltaproteobacteria bacterium]|nr:HDIG domain-containing protein [Deltaproteobacteria bacterium]
MKFSLEAFKDSPAAGWAGFALFCIAITWLTSFSVSSFPEKIDEGTVLRQDIRADRRIQIVNEEETKQDREKAAESVLPVFDFDESIPEEVPPRLHSILSRPIVSDPANLKPYKDKGVVLQRIRPLEETATEKELVIKDISKILSVEEAQKRVYPVFQKWIVPNTTYNLKETEQRKEAAIRAVKEKTITYQPGDYILRGGTKLEPKDVGLLERVKKARGLENRPIRFLGTFLFVALALGATFYFSERFIKRFLPKRKDYILMGLTVVLILFMLRGGLILSGVMHEAFFYDLPQAALYYGIPIAGGVMLVRMFLTAEVSLILAVILSLLAGLTVGSDVNYTTYCLISGIAASSAIAKATHRTAIIKAGILTGLASAAAVLGILLIRLAAVEGPFQWSLVGLHLGFAFLGGILASIFAFVATPVFETVLGYASDVKLLELSNLNHPLLRELIVRAPGTYHHSHIVGVLAEAAAEAIGANSLLAKVGAYYHDIGKMKKPSYFTENIAGRSRHEGLSPHMSALIVASHVKEGMAMAKTHKLPQRVIDMIPQHHGTKQIGIFYEMAKERADPNKPSIEEKDFRYPGPKPQTKEAGILMLADGVEASVRSLKEKTPMRIQKTAEEMIDKSFAEAQLDECDLTLKDLHAIGKAFTRILTALHHQRIAYGEDKPDAKASKAPPATAEAPKVSQATVHKLKFPKG